MPWSYFLFFKFPFQQQQSIWTTGTSQNVFNICYSFCFTLLFVQCRFSCFIFLKNFHLLLCLSVWVSTHITSLFTCVNSLRCSVLLGVQLSHACYNTNNMYNSPTIFSSFQLQFNNFSASRKLLWPMQFLFDYLSEINFTSVWLAYLSFSTRKTIVLYWKLGISNEWLNNIDIQKAKFLILIIFYLLHCVCKDTNCLLHYICFR